MKAQRQEDRVGDEQTQVEEEEDEADVVKPPGPERYCNSGWPRQDYWIGRARGDAPAAMTLATPPVAMVEVNHVH